MVHGVRRTCVFKSLRWSGGWGVFSRSRHDCYDSSSSFRFRFCFCFRWVGVRCTCKAYLETGNWKPETGWGSFPQMQQTASYMVSHRAFPEEFFLRFRDTIVVCTSVRGEEEGRKRSNTDRIVHNIKFMIYHVCCSFRCLLCMNRCKMAPVVQEYATGM